MIYYGYQSQAETNKLKNKYADQIGSMQLKGILRKQNKHIAKDAKKTKLLFPNASSSNLFSGGPGLDGGSQIINHNCKECFF